jgi:hypothetical protein
MQIRTLMSSVKTLAIQVPFSDKGCSVFVVQLLKCFPSLEVLHVEVMLYTFLVVLICLTPPPPVF